MAETEPKQLGAKKLAMDFELFELGIYIQDYGIHMAMLFNNVLPHIQSIARFAYREIVPKDVSLAA